MAVMSLGATILSQHGCTLFSKHPDSTLSVIHCIHPIASGGYYGFDFVTPTPPPPPQCVERFHHYHSNEKNIVASLLKFAGYVPHYKILTGNIIGLILKNKMAGTGVSLQS